MGHEAPGVGGRYSHVQPHTLGWITPVIEAAWNGNEEPRAALAEKSAN